MSTTLLKQQQAESAQEKETVIPFSRREFALMALICMSVFADTDILDSLSLHSKVRFDDWELDSLNDKLLDKMKKLVDN
jgi:hypothetical protein